MFKTVKAKFGRLDVLFNNAGIAAPGGRLHDIPMESVRTMMEVNLFGAWHVLKYDVKLMKIMIIILINIITYLQIRPCSDGGVW